MTTLELITNDIVRKAIEAWDKEGEIDYLSSDFAQMKAAILSIQEDITKPYREGLMLAILTLYQEVEFICNSDDEYFLKHEERLSKIERVIEKIHNMIVVEEPLRIQAIAEDKER